MTDVSKILYLKLFEHINFKKICLYKYLGGFLYLHKTHPAISSHRQSVMIAKARNLHSNLFTGLEMKQNERMSRCKLYLYVFLQKTTFLNVVFFSLLSFLQSACINSIFYQKYNYNRKGYSRH